jgi:tripartite ATP-independent transporter DctP family solute receptor
MRIQIYPNQQLGSERECLELLQIGSLDMTKVSGAVMENFAPNMRIFGLPFLFDDKEHLFRVLDGPIGKSLLKEGENYWLKGLGYYDSGSRSFYTRDRPITTPKDLEGLKIRVQESASAFEMVKQLGGSPTPISWGELYTSIQQGVVDAAENNPPSFYLSRHYEVCKYYSIDEHTMIPDILLASTHLWNRLSQQEQAWLQEALDRSILDQRRLWTISENESLQAVIDAGVKVTYPEKSPFQEATKTMYEDFKKNPAIASLIDQIQNEKN